MLAISSYRAQLNVCYRIITALFATCMALTGFSGAVSLSAQEGEEPREVRVFDLVQQDLEDDGQPDATIINSAFVTNRDRVIVYDLGNDMPWAESWQQATDFANDVWVFDAAADGKVELIIEFQQASGGAIEARLWDDQNGDGTVQHRPFPNFSIDESETPTIRVVAQDGWWLRDGEINFNLDVIVDGPVQASFSTSYWINEFEIDGTPDYLIQVRDLDDDGRPDYQWVNAWPDAPASWGVRRTEITANRSDDEPPMTGGIFWPFLGSTLDWDGLKEHREAHIPEDELDIIQEYSGYNKTYNASAPPIQMLWHKGALLYVSEFVASRFNDNSWFVYSISRVNPSRTSDVNFEAPFAFYDLAGDDDGYPELAVRFEQYLTRDQLGLSGLNPTPVQVVRYSWDQNDDRAWDYKLGLIGRHEVEETTSVGNLTLRMVPPAILPEWIYERTWDGATFVADEGYERRTSEGTYEWDPTGYWRDNYVTGLSSVRPEIDQIGSLGVGQRGEYSFDLHDEVRLYLSPIDNKLHLLGAEGGVWKVDGSREIHYANLGGDYLNQWTLVEDGVATESLFYVAEVGYLIYAGPSGVQLIQTDQPAALLTTSPPTSNSDWIALNDQLQPPLPDATPWDFEALVDTLGHSTVRLDGASIEDFRLIDDGFRFTLSTGAALDSGLMALEPGKYVVEYDGTFQVHSYTPPDLSLALQLVPAEEFTRSLPISVFVTASNEGLGDASELTLIVEASSDGENVEIARRTVDVLAGERTSLAWDWNPPTVGRWEVQARLESPDGELIEFGEGASIQVEDDAASYRQVLLVSAGGIGYIIPLVASLLAFVAVAIGITWHSLYTPAQSAPEDHRRTHRSGSTNRSLRLGRAARARIWKPQGLVSWITNRRRTVASPAKELVIGGFLLPANHRFQSGEHHKVNAITQSTDPGEVVRAIERSLPTLVVVREPRNATLSYVLDYPGVAPDDGFREYVAYYTRILPLRDHFEVATLDEGTNGMASAIDRINQRFGTHFEVPEDALDNTNNSLASIEGFGSLLDDAPAAERFRFAQSLSSVETHIGHRGDTDEIRSLIAQADELYRRLTTGPTRESRRGEAR